MSSTIPEELAPLLSVQRTVVFPIATFSALYFFYGLYVVLFGACVHMMRSRHPGDEKLNRNLYLSLTVLLFVFSTIYVVVYTIDESTGSIVRFNAVETHEYQPLEDLYTTNIEETTFLSIEVLLASFLNITADYMLIHRFHRIWGSRKRVSMPLIVISVLTNAVGLIAAIMVAIVDNDLNVASNESLFVLAKDMSFAYQIGSFIVNSALTLLTAGRIWWIHRQVRTYNIHTSDNFVHSISRIILESGLLYPIFGAMSLVAANNSVVLATPFDFFPFATLSAGFAPTLIIVRAKLGKTVETLQDQLSDIRFTSRPAPREQTGSAVGGGQVHDIRNIGTGRMDTDSEGSKEQRTTSDKETSTV